MVTKEAIKINHTISKEQFENLCSDAELFYISKNLLMNLIIQKLKNFSYDSKDEYTIYSHGNYLNTFEISVSNLEKYNSEIILSDVPIYLRQLLEKYFRLPQKEREKLILSENYSIVTEAIKKHKKVFVKFKNFTGVIEIFSLLPKSKTNQLYILFRDAFGNLIFTEFSKMEEVAVHSSNYDEYDNNEILKKIKEFYHSPFRRVRRV